MARRRINTNKVLSQIAEEFGKDVRDAAVVALQKGANLISSTAKSLCPVETGTLKNSIHTEAKITDKNAKIKVIADGTDPNGYCYARIVEFAPGRAHPFLIPARDQHAAEIRENAIDSMRQVIRKNWH